MVPCCPLTLGPKKTLGISWITVWLSSRHEQKSGMLVRKEGYQALLSPAWKGQIKGAASKSSWWWPWTGRQVKSGEELGLQWIAWEPGTLFHSQFLHPWWPQVASSTRCSGRFFDPTHRRLKRAPAVKHIADLNSYGLTTSAPPWEPDDDLLACTVQQTDSSGAVQRPPLLQIRNLKLYLRFLGNISKAAAFCSPEERRWMVGLGGNWFGLFL